MGLFNFFKSAPKQVDITDSLAFLGSDMHNHLLPGIDDGSQDVEDSIKFIKTLYRLGYRQLICTPHILSELYPNTRQTIEPAYNLLKQRLVEENIDIELKFAAEFMVNVDFEDIIKQDQLLPFGDKYLLIEMSYLAPSPNIKSVIFDLIMKGYKPIMAHPERYGFYHNKLEKFDEFIESGCLLQLNLLSLTGFYGKGVKKAAEHFINEKMVSFAGTDLHHRGHLDMLQTLVGDKKIMEQLHSIDWKNKTL
jgi:tyrosine-protein phosphatase YwqE